MKNLHKLLYILVSLLASIGCQSRKISDHDRSQDADSVQVFSLKKGMEVKDLSLPAELIPWEQAEIHAKIIGYVQSILVDIGDKVKKDQILAILEAPEIIANYAKSKSDYSATMSKYISSRDNFNRLKNASKEMGAISEIDLQNSFEQMLSDSSLMEAAESTAKSYEHLKNYLVIRAPFNGVITKREVDPGALVGKNDQPMLTIENIEKIRLRLAVPDMYSALIPNDNAIHFRVNAEPDLNFTASFSRRSGQVDRDTRTEIWEFIFLNNSGNLKPGMVTNAVLQLKRKLPVFTVPFSALVTNLERNFVIRIRDNKAEWVDIVNGISFRNNIEVFGPLNENDLLIVKANDEIKPGQELCIVK